MAILLILSFFQINYIYTGQPTERISQHSEYVPSRHVFIDKICQLDHWIWESPGLTPAQFADLAKEIPERKALIIRIKPLCYRLEEQDQRLVMIATSMIRQRKVKPFFVHCSPSGDYDPRFDTVMMPNGTIAVLNGIARGLGYDSSAIDESYPGPNLQGRERDFVLNYLRSEIEKSWSSGLEPVVYCTLLSYNSESSLGLLKTLKNEFGEKIKTGVGGQLVRVIPETYRNLTYIDQVGVGDAEVILQPMLAGQNYAEGWLDSGLNFYAEPNYHGYLGLNNRLNESSRYAFGPFTGIRNLCIESVRGCSWAYLTGKPCEMCALQGVSSQPVFKPFQNHFDLENQLAREFGINWLFDVSNQFIPVTGKNQADWLRGYLIAKNQYSEVDINKYVYLTAASFSSETAPLLREAGIRIAYVGFDGWERGTRTALHKPNINPMKVLQLCRENDIYVRTSFVIGAGLTDSNLNKLPKLVDNMMAGYGDVVLSCGSFLQIIIPGSPAWAFLQKEALEQEWGDVNDIYHFFITNGFLTWEQEEQLTKAYIQRVQNLDYDKVVAVRNYVKALVDSETIAITIRDGGTLLS
jgi:hypothetical protein